MAKQIFDLTTDGAPARTRWLMLDSVTGDATFKMQIETLLGLATKADVGLSNVENTALSTWAGTNMIVTVGTIANGTWQGTPIADAYVASAANWNAAYDAVATPGNFLRYASANLHVVDGNVVENLLLNGDFVVAQLGTSFTSTGGANNDDTYNFDQWILLADGNDTVDIMRETDAPPAGRYSAKLEVETINRKFGLLQIVESSRCKHVVDDGVVTAAFELKGSGIAKVYAAILSWDGTADSVTSDVVSAWGAAGAEPTWAADWTREGDVVEVTSFADWTEVILPAVEIDSANTKQFALFIWSDDTATTLGDYIAISCARAVAGDTNVPFVPADPTDELLKCSRYLQKCTIGPAKANSASNMQVSIFHPLLRTTPASIFASAALQFTDATAADFSQSSPDVNTVHDSRQHASRVSCGLFSGMSSGTVMVPMGAGGDIMASARL